ncbi:MAG: Glutamate-tRNA ligase [Candidatus Giovannonibacteria bacterium GW2011_GWA2_44_13b]|uniref:Glutamate--tRNA ligase n=2 Tax=Candidatus Giovannoniibacteriota TaxID=1752738 RepID=A0A0G1K3H1_9BACT|nr:MAG: Glutamate-tRNA ligase [Candidatus Giovannonibacteria bacterium GW2011_GWA2_44_13b]OGF82787.1 MAG: glutamate--tRNA ligase [Candidatus Giovannonibacteria bacterium RIFCSPLOWO2_01_FULL_44_16]
MRVKTRIAPSPTGYLHVGTARTALFNFLYARHYGGEFILRIEDTDIERSEAKFEDDIVAGLKWLGIEWDGEITRQSERLDVYENYLKKILEDGRAFYCPHSQQELDEERKKQVANKFSPQHTCDARDLSAQAGRKSDKGLIRFKNDAEKIIKFKDEIRGEIEFDPSLLGDFSLAKDLRAPLYNFAVVVDDATMEISHVIRGEDHISNTPKQILLEKALGLPQPIFAHLPLILGKDRSKLSKRHGATSIIDYKNEGYLSDALFNFMALLGWRTTDDQARSNKNQLLSTGKELYTKDELIQLFSLERVQGAGAIFDMTKLEWMNGEYIRRKSPRELLELASFQLGDLIKNKPKAFLEKVIALEQPRLKKLSELPEKTDYFFKDPEYDAELLRWKKMSDDDIKNSLKLSMETLKAVNEDDFTKENLEKIFMAKAGKDRGELLWPLRVALSGKKFSPGPFEIMAVLGKDTAISRINAAISMLK